jgi:uncharacterized LabA/DUF88 family protein
MIDRAEVFIIVSGDGGYCSLVAILRRLGKRVIVLAVESLCHPNLKASANEFFPIPVVFDSGRNLVNRNSVNAMPGESL